MCCPFMRLNFRVNVCISADPDAHSRFRQDFGTPRPVLLITPTWPKQLWYSSLIELSIAPWRYQLDWYLYGSAYSTRSLSPSWSVTSPAGELNTPILTPIQLSTSEVYAQVYDRQNVGHIMVLEYRERRANPVSMYSRHVFRHSRTRFFYSPFWYH